MAEAPRTPSSSGVALRRIVLTVIVLGVVSLLGYAGWQRVANASPMVAPAPAVPAP